MVLTVVAEATAFCRRLAFDFFFNAIQLLNVVNRPIDFAHFVFGLGFLRFNKFSTHRRKAYD